MIHMKYQALFSLKNNDNNNNNNKILRLSSAAISNGALTVISGDG